MPHLIIAVNDKDHIRGPFNAPVTLVEYGDYQCSLCKLASSIVKQLQNELDPHLRFVFRHFPLKETHPFAEAAAKVAEAAGRQNKFWEMHDALNKLQRQMDHNIFVQLAQELQLDVSKFKLDLLDPVITHKIHEDFMMGVRSGVNGTPCFFINGERYDGDPSYNFLKHALRKAYINE